MNNENNLDKFVSFVEVKINQSDEKILHKKDIMSYIRNQRCPEKGDSCVESLTSTKTTTPLVKDEENSSIQSVTEPLIVVNTKGSEQSNISSPSDFVERKKPRKQKRQLSADDYSAYAYITRLHPDWFMKASNNLSPFKNLSMEKSKDTQDSEKKYRHSAVLRMTELEKHGKKNKKRYSSPKPLQNFGQSKANNPQVIRTKLSTRSKSETSSTEIPNIKKPHIFTDQWGGHKTRNNKRNKKLSNSAKPWASLPEELLWKVFSHLDIRSLLTISRVCTMWFNICNDIDVRPYYLSKKAFLERKVIYKHLITKGNPVPIPVPLQHRNDVDLSHLATEKRLFIEKFHSGNHWYYNHIYQISSDQLNRSGAYKKTQLPPTTYSKTKLLLLFPEGCINQIHYCITVQGVEISSGRLSMYNILHHSDQSKDINLDPILLHASAFLRLIYLITLGVIKH